MIVKIRRFKTIILNLNISLVASVLYVQFIGIYFFNYEDLKRGQSSDYLITLFQLPLVNYMFSLLNTDERICENHFEKDL